MRLDFVMAAYGSSSQVSGLLTLEEKGVYPSYSVTVWLIEWLFRKRIAKMNYKYFQGNRTREMFERYKTYHLLVYRLT